jgi:chaperone LolA
MTVRIRHGVAVLAAWVAVQAHAAGLPQLHDFLAQTRSASGAFEQVAPGPRKSTVRSTGHFEFQRPGRFRWAVETPFAQLIVADGQWLIVHDPDLQQVTRRRLTGALPASPASILFGSDQFEKDFRLSEDGSTAGTDWVLALPTSQDAPFTRVRIGFHDGLPVAMELRDAFGQDTRLAFSHIERNPAIDASHFRFTPPPGTDVLDAQ